MMKLVKPEGEQTTAVPKTMTEVKTELALKKGRLARERTKVSKDITKAEAMGEPLRTTALKDLNDKLDAIEQELADINTDLDTLKDSDKAESETFISEALQKVKTDILDQDPSAGYSIEDEQYMYIEDYAEDRKKQNVQMRAMSGKSYIDFLANRLKLKTWHLPEYKVKDLYMQENRVFEMKRYSIGTGMWKRNSVYLPIEHMVPYFIHNFKLTPEELEEVKNDVPWFDVLMHSLSGGKKENIDAIEKWLLHKVINYSKASTTPDFVIVGHVGGNGKGILQAIIRIIIPAMLSGKANSKTLNGNFNAIMLGKLIVFFDDQLSKEIPLEMVKQLAGSDTMIFEPKGKDQYEGEKTHSSAWFSNNLPFRLTPAGQEGGVDRRFSIMRTNITLLESIRRHIKETLNTEITIEESKDYAETIVKNIYLNRISIAYWFQTLMQRHPEVTSDYTLKPLHGEDYHYFLENQQDSAETVFYGLVKPVLEANGTVPVFVIKEIMRHLDGKVTGDKAIVTKMRELASQNKIDLDSDRTTILIVSGTGKNVSKQCGVLYVKGSEYKKEFEWDRVSRSQYRPAKAGEELIGSDDLTFGNEYVAKVNSLFEELDDNDDDDDDDSPAFGYRD